MTERLTLPVGVTFPKSTLEVSIDFDAYLKDRGNTDYQPIPTGFLELDEWLGGGLHPESLMLVGGPPGVGKTVLILQAARNIAASGNATACVVCFEHSEVYLYHRLLCLESACGGEDGVPITLADLRAVSGMQSAEGLQALLDNLPQARAAWQRLVGYWERLYLVKGHPLKTTIHVLDTYLTHLRVRCKPVVLFVDYLQKLPVVSMGAELTAEKQIRIVTEGLKNVAMSHRVPVVAVAASDAEGLRKEGVRFQDLWGGSSVQYEPDVALMLNPSKNEKREARAERTEIVFSIEKNRLGPANVEMHLDLLGPHFAFKSRLSN